jgi:hypothetical protein
MSRVTLGLTQPPIKLVLEVLSLGVKQAGHEIERHLHLVLRLRISGVVPLLRMYAFMV